MSLAPSLAARRLPTRPCTDQIPPYYDPTIGIGNIVAVGSYSYTESPSGTTSAHGVYYQGPIDGSGTFTEIDATPLAGSGTLLNTIAHSMMGTLVVGNYDTSLATGKAFIYNLSSNTWTDLNPEAGATVTGTSLSATAYGIWQDGGPSSTKYTIAGGYSDIDNTGVDAGYLVDYDSSTGLLTNFREYQFDGEPLSSVYSHFDGITATADGFNLTGDFVDIASGSEGGFLPPSPSIPTALSVTPPGLRSSLRLAARPAAIPLTEEIFSASMSPTARARALSAPFPSPLRPPSWRSASVLCCSSCGAASCAGTLADSD